MDTDESLTIANTGRALVSFGNLNKVSLYSILLHWFPIAEIENYFRTQAKVF